jgi:hypothetical protein
MLDDIRQNLLDQWQVIADAPAIFAMAVLVVAALIWIAMRWAYGARIQHKDAQIALQQAQIDDYRRKLDGASPDEARARIAALEKIAQGRSWQ